MNAVITATATATWAGVDDMKSKNISRNFVHVRVFSFHEISEINKGGNDTILFAHIYRE